MVKHRFIFDNFKTLDLQTSALLHLVLFLKSFDALILWHFGTFRESVTNL